MPATGRCLPQDQSQQSAANRRQIDPCASPEKVRVDFGYRAALTLEQPEKHCRWSLVSRNRRGARLRWDHDGVASLYNIGLEPTVRAAHAPTLRSMIRLDVLEAIAQQHEYGAGGRARCVTVVADPRGDVDRAIRGIGAHRCGNPPGQATAGWDHDAGVIERSGTHFYAMCAGAAAGTGPAGLGDVDA